MAPYKAKCGLCGRKFETVGLVTRHRFKAHPKEAAEIQARALKVREDNIRANGHSNGNGRGKRKLSAEDMLAMMRARRDVMNDVISEFERLIN